MGKLFGTDGVRGMANEGNMTAEMALQIGRATAYTCKEYHKEKGTRPRIIIGKDTRLSGYMFENALTAGITSMGVDVLLLGPIPTPAVAFITQSMRADMGLVISASHNPYYDNGIKIFGRTGYKLPDAMEAEIEDLVLSGRINNIRPVAQEIGKARRIDDAMGRYIEFCKNTFPDDMTLDGMKVVLDCSNGATYKCAPLIFSELGADVSTIHAAPDGININDNCGSQHTQDLCVKIKGNKADVGLAFDGDGDRLIAVDENGCKLTGDQIIAICTKYYKDAGLLKNNLVVGTVMSNIGFHVALKELGIDTDVADVGDRYVLEMMRERGAVLGGEDSGHIIFNNFHTTGDGIVSALQLLAIMRKSGKKLSELALVMKVFPQVLINIDVAEKPPIAEIEKLQEAITEAKAELAEKGRVLIRYSGTQPMCRVMVEGPSEKQTQTIAERLTAVVKECIG
ncbi:phosphoglucosamine mutase [Pontiella sulfatireligans]|uniref:Phosphoglucosamine mutase n=1 Tax=Pontiella sulfatireligans TaxID=2750658 RepID=A0A6C2UG06_9BACT|nr:phosphoglucosamine mutase [Pontiella sulfatireligans]VGO18457.1 Phosphoglucosamine mutase [Pontiella sulfatireligans]